MVSDEPCVGKEGLAKVQTGQKAVERKKGPVLAGAGVSKGIDVRAILFGEDRRVHRLEDEPGAMSSSMKVDRRWVNHDESVGAGGDAWAYQAASWRVGNCPITIKVPTLHTGHRATSKPVTSSITSRADFLGVRFGCGSTPRSSRHCTRFCFLERLARKPKWRTRMKPSGRTWSKKRRMNSSGSSVIDRSLLAFLRSR